MVKIFNMFISSFFEKSLIWAWDICFCSLIWSFPLYLVTVLNFESNTKKGGKQTLKKANKEVVVATVKIWIKKQ